MIFAITSESLVVIGPIFGGSHIPMTTFFGFKPHLVIRITIRVILSVIFIASNRNNPIILIFPRHPWLIGSIPRHSFPNFKIIPFLLPIDSQLLIAIISPMNRFALIIRNIDIIISKIKSILTNDISLAHIFVITNRLMGGIVVLLNLVFLHLVVIVLIWFATGHEPNRHYNVESNDYQQIYREHEDIRPGILIVYGYPTCSNRN